MGRQLAEEDPLEPPVSTVQRTRRHRLTVIWKGGNREEEIPEGRLTVGRLLERDIVLEHPSVSRLHAAIHVGRRCSIVDLGSSNGTRVAGRRVEVGKAVPLRPGVPVAVGDVVLILGAVVEASGQRDGVE